MFDLDCPVHGRELGELAVKAIDEGRVIAEQPPGRCELCGKVDETRPYGPKGEEVCYDCGTKDPDAMDRGFKKRFGV